jgi:hydroxyethylthiazole kinase
METIQTRMADEIATLLERLRERRPLIHHITNLVVMNDTANITLAIGALPVMAHAAEEVEEMVEAAGVLLLNIGTLTPELVTAMVRAGRRANERGIPVVLDPVGAGATRLRTASALRILEEVRVHIIRANAAEVGALIGNASEIRGVESIALGGDREEIARAAAARFGCTVAVTGAQDIITDGRQVARVHNGDAMLGRITGTGCMATTLVAAFAAVEPDAVRAGTAGLVCMGLAGERAAAVCQGPGTFRAALLDAVANLDRARIVAGAQVEVG